MTANQFHTSQTGLRPFSICKVARAKPAIEYQNFFEARLAQMYLLKQNLVEGHTFSRLPGQIIMRDRQLSIVCPLEHRRFKLATLKFMVRKFRRFDLLASNLSLTHLLLSYLLLSNYNIISLPAYLDDTIGVSNAGNLAEHGFRAAVACFGEFDGPCHGDRLDVMARNNVFDANFYEHLWMFVSAYAVYMHLIACHILAFLA